MAWIRNYEYKWYETLALNVIKSSPVPNHVAFIMDGNRRFAKNAKIEKIDGHTKGFDKLSECVRWSLDVGIKNVTMFAFSKENFNRSPDEVSDLMDLAKAKFEKLIEEEDGLRENGIRIRVIGNLTLLSEELQVLIAKAMLLTENNDKLNVNIAFAYTSREEITNSIQSICHDEGELMPEDITDELVRHCLYTKDLPDPDLLIRTSGESRISDFLMWQISSTVLYFTKALWPGTTLWHLLCMIFLYQQTLFKFSTFKHQIQHDTAESKEVLPERVKNFLRKVDADRHDFLVNSSAKFNNINQV